MCVFVQLCSTLFWSIDGSPSGSSVRVIFQAKILERVAISFSRGQSLEHQTTREVPTQIPPDDRHFTGMVLILLNLPHTVFLEWKDTKQWGRWRQRGPAKGERSCPN